MNVNKSDKPKLSAKDSRNVATKASFLDTSKQYQLFKLKQNLHFQSSSVATEKVILNEEDNDSLTHEDISLSLDSTPNVPVKNSFAPLQRLAAEDKMDTSGPASGSNNNQSSQVRTTGPRLPPIIVPQLPPCNNYFKYHKDLEKELGNNMKVIYNNNYGTKYHVSSLDAFHKLQGIFKERNIEFFTYLPKFQKPLQVVIKRLQKEITAEQLKEELELLDYPVINVRQMSSSSHTTSGLVVKNMLPLWVVSLKNNDLGREIYQLKGICHQTVLVETYNPKQKIYQCFNCQQFGHTSAGCHIKPRCVKCGQNHRFADCPIKGTTYEPKCANCGGSHTANYSKCEHIRIQKEQLNAKKMEKQVRMNQRDSLAINNPQEFPALPNTTPPVWFNSVNQSQSSNNSNKSIFEDVKEILTYFKQFNISQILHSIRSTSQKLKSANDTITKISILVEGFTEIFCYGEGQQR